MSTRMSIPQLIRSRVLIDQQLVPGTFIFLFLKLGLLFSFLILGTVVFDHLDAGKEFLLLFILAPIVMFLHQWMTLRL